MNENLKERWFKPVNRLGITTEIIAIITSYFPFLYLFFTYRQVPELSVFFAGMGTIASAYIVGWVVEPISYFPALGTAGTYMGMLAGSSAQMRVPAAMIAKSVAGVQDETQEAEIVATCGIAGSIYMNLIILFLTAVFGSAIISILPESVLNAMAAYVLPSIFGALIAMFTTKGRLKLTFPIFAVAALLMSGVLPLPSWTLTILCVVAGVVVARVDYKLGWLK